MQQQITNIAIVWGKSRTNTKIADSFINSFIYSFSSYYYVTGIVLEIR